MFICSWYVWNHCSSLGERNIMEDKKLQEINAQETDKQKIDNEELDKVSGGWCWPWEHNYVKTGRTTTEPIISLNTYFRSKTLYEYMYEMWRHHVALKPPAIYTESYKAVNTRSSHGAPLWGAVWWLLLGFLCPAGCTEIGGIYLTAIRAGPFIGNRLCSAALAAEIGIVFCSTFRAGPNFIWSFLEPVKKSL